MRERKLLLVITILMGILGTHFLLAGLKEPPLEFVSQPALANAVAKTNLDRFPGEGKLMMMLNQSSVRNTIHVLQASRYADSSGLSYLNPPSYYGEEDFLQIAQEHGVDVYQMINDPAVRESLQADPETYRRLQQLGWVQ